MGPMIITIDMAEIDSLAPMPASVVKLTQMVSNPDSGVHDIARVVELDQALTANVLRSANSALSASRTKITTVKNAVVRLGTAQILKLAVGQQVVSAMSEEFTGYGLCEHELWRHSVASALASESIGKYASVPIPGISFTAALLHDIGKLLLERHLNAEVTELMLSMIEDKGITWLEAEHRILGTDHTEVGAAIARHWNFPDELVLAIEHHHDPDPMSNTLLDVVHISNSIAKLIGVGLGAEQMHSNVSKAAAERLGLSQTDMESLCAKVKDDLIESEKQYKE
ncbi:HDOD domain-containing protein [bacterium]|nr:HDOD domain-containing protein [bacterium]